MGIHNVFATNLRRFRKEQGLTQEELAEKSGLHRTYIGGIEQERINVSLKNVAVLAEALDIDPVYFFLMPKKDSFALPNNNLEDDKYNDYALLHETEDGISITPLDVIYPDLSVQILCTLIQEGFDGQELIMEYDKAQSILIGYFQNTRMANK